VCFAFYEWNLGGKIIFISGCIALFSMLLPWISFFGFTASGFSGAYFLLLGLFVYPLSMLLQNRFIDMQIGYISSGLAALIAIIIIARIRQASHGLNVVGSGAYIFLLSAVAMGVGIYLYYNHTDGYRQYH
jgi:hypothetical protein